jgi:hypothetical protein
MKGRIPVSILISVLLTLVLITYTDAADVKFTASDSVANYYFGYSVSISGNETILCKNC